MTPMRLPTKLHVYTSMRVAAEDSRLQAFSYTAGQLEALERSLSAECLTPYRSLPAVTLG